MRCCAITTLFHPGDNRFRYANFLRFSKALEMQGVPLLTIQCLAPGESNLLFSNPRVITVRCADRLWQKERLLNIALDRLPSECVAVAWLDADVIFDNPRWLTIACERLADYPVVQPFSEVVLLGREQAALPPDPIPATQSFFSQTAARPELLHANFEAHGHTGFAWVGRVSFLREVTFYDKAVVGGGDHLIAHAFSGTSRVPCIDRLLGSDTPFRRDYDAWISKIRLPAAKKMPFVQGRLFHLWHGPLSARRYAERNREFMMLNFDPSRELDLNGDGCWEWIDPQSTAANFVRTYIVGRANADNLETQEIC